MLEPSFIPKLGSSFWPKLYAFYYVVCLQSYSRAAEHLKISQSSLSRAVQALEDRLKTVLLLRNRRGKITLTEQGQTIFWQVERVIIELGVLESSLPPIQPQPSCCITLKISDWLLSDYCIDSICHFKKNFPNLSLKICTSMKPENRVDPFFDITIGCGLKPNKTRVQKPLLSFGLGCYASKEYLRMHGEPRTEKDLEKHLLYRHNQTVPIFEAFRKYSDKRASILNIHSSACLVKIAEADLGIIALARNNSALQGRGLVLLLEVLTKSYGLKRAYFCCSKETWDREEVQALYKYLKLQIKRISNTVMSPQHN